MEHSTFSADSVKKKLAGYHEVRFQAEHPNESPAKDVLDHFKVMGLPSFVVLTPESRQVASVKK
jgi:thiol:disulfide interchange protein